MTISITASLNDSTRVLSVSLTLRFDPAVWSRTPPSREENQDEQNEADGLTRARGSTPKRLRASVSPLRQFDPQPRASLSDSVHRRFPSPRE